MGVFYFALRPTTWPLMLAVWVFRVLLRIHERSAWWWFRVTGMHAAAERCHRWLHGSDR